jgi:hypothetical protein
MKREVGGTYSRHDENLAVWGKLIFVFMAPTAGFVFLTVTLLCVISINLSHTVREPGSLAKE